MEEKGNIIEKYMALWLGGKNVMENNVKVGIKIRIYCLKKLNEYRQKNPELFGEKELTQLNKMVTELKQNKNLLSSNAQNCTLNDYTEFLEDFFTKVDEEDRNGTVTLKTSTNFRLLSYFIEVLNSWGPLDEDAKKVKKYCEFKAVDIFKALKNGEIPKRGGFDEFGESEDEQGNEIKESDKNNNNNNDNNDSNLGNKIIEYENIIKELKEQLEELNVENQNLIMENIKLNNEIKRLNLEVEKSKQFEEKNLLLEKEIENKNIEIQKLGAEINNKNLSSINPGEKIISINFRTLNSQDITNYSLPCKNTDLFVRLEERLYRDFPQYKDCETFFQVNTRRIKRFKTLEENKIKANDIISILVYE